MKYPIPSCADVLRVASHALRVALSGSGAVLKVCGQKIKSFAIPNHSTPQPNA